MLVPHTFRVEDMTKILYIGSSKLEISRAGYRGYAITSNPPYIGASWGGKMPKAGTETPYIEEFGVAMTCIA